MTNDEFWQIQDFLSELRVILDVVITTDERLEKALPAEFLDLTCGEFYAKEEVQRLLTAQELRTVQKFPDYIEFLTDEEVEDILKNVELEINEKARQSK